MNLIYAGFDGLDVTFQGFLPRNAIEALETAKLSAQETKQPAFVEIGFFKGHVGEAGAKGGFAYCVDTGKLGFTWFFGKSEKRDAWQIRVSCKSATLAARGFEGTLDAMYHELDVIGATVLAERIARVDYAMDWRVDGAFRLDPHRFTLHGTTKAQAHGAEIEHHWQKRTFTGLTIGKMPGRQICIYDKRKDIVAKRKAEWWEIWGIDREEFEGSGDQIFRIEVRAGKKHLKEQWGVNTWDDLRDRLGDIYQHALDRVCLKSRLWGEHENVTRIADDEWWQRARAVISKNLFEWISGAEPGVIKEVIEDQQRQMISAQMIGLSANLAVLSGLPEDRLFELPGMIAAMLAENVKGEEAEKFKIRMKKVLRRYEIIDADGVIRGGTGFAGELRGEAYGEKRNIGRGRMPCMQGAGA